MKEWVMAGGIVTLLGLRVTAYVRLWNIPFYYGADRFFGLPVPAPAYRPLLHRFRVWIYLPCGPEILAAVAAYLWGGLPALFVEQAAVYILAQFYFPLLAIHTVRQAKWLALGDSWKPVASVALSLKVRRLRDYSSLPFELAVVLGTIAALALFLACEPFRQPGPPPHLMGYLALCVLAFYLQGGGLLIKHGLVKWRMWLPGERTEEYLRWREAVLHFYLWICDYLRGVSTLALVIFASAAYFRGTGHVERVLPTAQVGAAGIILGAFIGARRHRKMAALWKTLQPLEDFSAPPQAIDPREFFLGGLCYSSADNPSLLVPGPLVYAVNLANLRVYLYLAYFAGLVFLGFWCAGILQS